MPRKNHTHKYIRRETGSSPVWACALEDCNHFMPNHLTNLVIGRSTYCWDCGDKFKMTELSMVDDMPKCESCRLGIKRDEDKLFDTRADIFSEFQKHVENK
jgi:hypothetical protein